MNSLNCAAVRFKIKYLYGYSNKYKKRGWFSLMWGQSITLCFIWSCHKSLTALMYAPHPPPPPPSSPSYLSPCLPCSDPSYTLSLSLGVRSTPSCISQREIKHHSGSARCILKSFLALVFQRLSRCGGKKQVWWVTWYVLWDFAQQLVLAFKAFMPLEAYTRTWCSGLRT